MNELIQSVERRQSRKLPGFREGDKVRVHFQVIEGTRKRTQVFEGVVLKLQGPGIRRTFSVRKLSFGVGVERTFPLHSPKIESIEIVARGEVRRAKLYYLRGRIGRRAKVSERRDLTPEEQAELGQVTEIEAELTDGADAAEVAENEPTDVDPGDDQPEPDEAPEASEAEQAADDAGEAEAGDDKKQVAAEAEGDEADPPSGETQS